MILFGRLAIDACDTASIDIARVSWIRVFTKDYSCLFEWMDITVYVEVREYANHRFGDRHMANEIELVSNNCFTTQIDQLG